MATELPDAAAIAMPLLEITNCLKQCLPLKTYTRRMKVYKLAFLGRDAVEFLCGSNIAESVEDAHTILSALLQDDMIVSARSLGGRTFREKDLFQFTSDIEQRVQFQASPPKNPPFKVSADESLVTLKSIQYTIDGGCSWSANSDDDFQLKPKCSCHPQDHLQVSPGDHVSWKITVAATVEVNGIYLVPAVCKHYLKPGEGLDKFPNIPLYPDRIYAGKQVSAEILLKCPDIAFSTSSTAMPMPTARRTESLPLHELRKPSSIDLLRHDHTQSVSYDEGLEDEFVALSQQCDTFIDEFVSSDHMYDLRHVLDQTGEETDEGLGGGVVELEVGLDGALIPVFFSAPYECADKHLRRSYDRNGVLYMTERFLLVDETGLLLGSFVYCTKFAKDTFRVCDDCLSSNLQKVMARRQTWFHTKRQAVAFDTWLQELPEWKKSLMGGLRDRDRREIDPFVSLPNWESSSTPDLGALSDTSLPVTNVSPTRQASVIQMLDSRKTTLTLINVEEAAKVRPFIDEVPSQVMFLEATDGTKLAFCRFGNLNPSQTKPDNLSLIIVGGIGLAYNWGHKLGGLLWRDHKLSSWLLINRGHGQSEGAPGHCPHRRSLWRDLRSLVRHVKWNSGKDIPIILMGHGTGANIVCNYAAWKRREPVTGYFIAAPHIKSYTTQHVRSRSKRESLIIKCARTTNGLIGGKSHIVDLSSPEVLNMDLDGCPTVLTANLVASIEINNGPNIFQSIDRPFALYLPEDDVMDAAKMVADANKSPVSNKHIEVLPNHTNISLLDSLPLYIDGWLQLTFPIYRSSV